MYQAKAQHPLSDLISLPDVDTQKAMWKLFVQIGKFWQNIEDPSPYRTRLQSFMLNRIGIYPLYRDYYITAKIVIDKLIEERGEDKAYELLFTDSDANKAPPTTPLALTRQKVSNEFVAFQLALGGFKSFGAINYCGYFGGANAPDEPVPYRPMETIDGH